MRGRNGSVKKEAFQEKELQKANERESQFPASFTQGRFHIDAARMQLETIMMTMMAMMMMMGQLSDLRNPISGWADGLAPSAPPTEM